MSTALRAAHPFGDPQTVEIDRGGGTADVVHVNWKVGAADDLTLLGIHLEVLPEDRVLLDGAIEYDEGDAQLVQDSAEVPAYVLDHVAVSADGAACAGEVTQVGDLVEQGADITFTCPAAVQTASVQVTTLTDMHEAYRTLATGTDGQRQVYEGAHDTFDWALPPADTAAAGGTSSAADTGSAGDSLDTGASAALQMGGVIGAVLLLAVAGTAWFRRKQLRQPTPHGNH